MTTTRVADGSALELRGHTVRPLGRRRTLAHPPPPPRGPERAAPLNRCSAKIEVVIDLPAPVVTMLAVILVVVVLVAVAIAVLPDRKGSGDGGDRAPGERNGGSSPT